ncbi:MAG: chemotaxis protein CheA [Nevskia sp.]|nr:chemotaxis protein CheA [Nevskia sp.]
MKIDLARFHATFFEESFEGLDVMERGLLQLDAGVGQGGAAAAAVDPETVNAVFRAAHSIKGGAATFGFGGVAAFTHHIETLLDEMRGGTRRVSRRGVDLLLRALDALRGLLVAARDGAEANSTDAAAAAAVQRDLEQFLGAPQAAPQAEPARPASLQGAGFQIRFAPFAALFRSGNDPLMILRELAELGRTEVELDTERMPAFAQADPEACYMAWNIRLHTDQPRARLEELFAWVEDECELEIDPLAAVSAPAQGMAAVAQPSAPVLQTLTARLVEHGAAESSSIRVNTAKIDALINLVGELVITQAMLAQNALTLDPAQNERLLMGLQQLDRNTRQLQEAVLSTRMLPIEAVFNRFPRMLRDLAGKLGKQVRLETDGEATELDKAMIEKITDPLTHLVRNCVDHGIEPPALRAAAGKPAEGTIRLAAAHQGGNIRIEVSDDGGGLDRARILASAQAKGIAASESMSDAEVWQLIFAPGFSTKEQVTDISGRGVGMDVVKRNIQALGGHIELESEAGRGMRVVIRLPLTLAILDGMTIAAGGETFIVPLNCVVESLRPEAAQLKSVAGQGRVLRVREEYLPVVALHDLFNIGGGAAGEQRGIVVVLEAEGRKMALQVDELVGQQQVVIKNVEANYRRVFGVSGATILGDGRVALILDAAALVRSTWRAAAA